LLLLLLEKNLYFSVS